MTGFLSNDLVSVAAGRPSNTLEKVFCMASFPESATRLAKFLTRYETPVMERWVAVVSGELRGRGTRGELDRDLRALLAAIVNGLEQGSLSGDAEAFDSARSLLTEWSHARARQGFTPRETVVAVFALKGAYVDVAAAADEEAATDFPALSRLIDELGLFSFETFVAARERIITDQAEQLLELSTPVVKLWEGVVAVPLVGTLDSARTQVVMEKLLQTLVETGSQHAIIDITGVPAVDTQVAQHLLKTVVAARLMGAECIISGIRPQIAQTIVALGIEFGDIRTKATLADALVAALRSNGTAITTRRPKES
jgi:rsbT co-antagonist protein RsbR